MSLNCFKKLIERASVRRAESRSWIVYSGPCTNPNHVDHRLGEYLMVSVQIFGQTLRAVVEENELDVPVSGPITVKQLIEANPTQLGALLRYITSREALITINKKIGSEDSTVRDGDIVKFSFQSRASYDGTRDIPT